MKTLAVLLLLIVTVTFGVLIYCRDSPAPLAMQTHSALKTRSFQPPPSELRPLQPHVVQAVQPSRSTPLPLSFAGTQVDGQLHADPAGDLIIDGDIRRVFDYFLASIGEETIEASVTRLQRYIETQLPQPAELHATQLLSQYLDYKRQLLVLEKEHAQQPDLNAMRARLSAARELRAGIFDDATHQAFFALDEAADGFTLERLAIRHDRTLSASEQGAALDRLRSSLPLELQDTVAIQLQSELRAQTSALQAKSGTLIELRNLRQRLVGNAAASRLEQLDARRRDWQSRVFAYRQDKSRIESSRGLGNADKQAAIHRLASQRFDETERQRLEAAERLLAVKNG